MLEKWIAQVAAKIGNQAEAGRILQDRLRRSFDRAAVNKMLKGTRAIAADEAIVLSELTGVPLPAKLMDESRGLPPETVQDAAEVILRRMRHSEEEARKGAIWIVQTAEVLRNEPQLDAKPAHETPQRQRLEHSNEE